MGDAGFISSTVLQGSNFVMEKRFQKVCVDASSNAGKVGLQVSSSLKRSRSPSRTLLPFFFFGVPL